MRAVFAILAVVSLSPGSARAEESVRRARPGDPGIVAVRAMYRAVEQSIARKRLAKEQRTVEECGPLGEDRTIFSNADGVIRKYVWQTGSGDSLITVRHYYDPQGRMRFVFATAGAVNGTQLEHRIYFDEQGVRIRESRDFKSGPGWTFPQFSEEEGLLSREPRRAYDAGCPAGG